MTRQIKIDLYSDPVCPWCLVGLARLDIVVAALPDGVDVDIEHHPFLLDADASIEGEDVAEMLARKYGRDPSEMWDRLEAEAKASGVDLDMRKQKTRYASQPAQALIAAAREKGTQHALARAIGDACYLSAENIADADVLVRIAGDYGFDDDEARQIVTDKVRWTAIENAATEASSQGVQGVPFFIFAQKFALSGAQPEEVFARALASALDGEDAATQ